MPTPEVVISPVDNDLYPLPADYLSLTREGQRQGRVNASRQWYINQFDPEAAWMSYVFFDQYYFRDPEYSTWYQEMDPLPHGGHHKDLITAWYEHNGVVCLYPRGFGKSRVCNAHGLVQRPLTRPRHTAGYVGPDNVKVREEMTRSMVEFEQNSRIIDDWSIEYGVNELRKKRTDTGEWSAHGRVYRLPNASRVRGGSIESGIRGMRAKEIILDDVERDLKRSTDIAGVRSQLEHFIFHTLKPVTRMPGWRIIWPGTKVSLRHYIATVASTHDDRDPRFDSWKKLPYQAAYPNIDDLKVALWPERMSIADVTTEIKESGRAAVLAEYFNDPGVRGGGGFTINQTLQEWVAYESDGVTPVDPMRFVAEDLGNPSQSNAVIKWVSGASKSLMSVPLKQMAETFPGVQSFDWGRSTKITADYSSTPNGLYGPERELFVMDIMLGRWSVTQKNEHILRQAWKWRPKAIGVEAFSAANDVMEEVRTLCEDLYDKTGYRPRVKRIKIHGAEKTDKILGMSWRFGSEEDPRGLIKLPFFLRKYHAGFRMLLHQIENANFEAPNLGLTNDDAIDSVRMLDEIFDNSPKADMGDGEETASSVKDKLLSGERRDRWGVPLIEKVGIENLTEDEIERVVDEQQRRRRDQGGTRGVDRKDRHGNRIISFRDRRRR